MKHKKSREKKTENIHLRLTKREKNRLQRRAEELGTNVSEYIRILTLKKEIRGGRKADYCKLIVLCQDLVSYIQQRYDRVEDQELAERMERVWKLLMSF